MTQPELISPGESEMTGPPVWVRIGPMDDRAVQQARQVLHQASSRADTSLVVDLAGLDARHEHTMFSLLAETSRAMAAHGGLVTALNPTVGLAPSLVSCGIRVIRFGPPPPRASGTLTIDIGDSLTTLRIS